MIEIYFPAFPVGPMEPLIHLLRAYVIAVFFGKPISGRALKVIEMKSNALEDYFPLNHASKDIKTFCDDIFGIPCKFSKIEICVLVVWVYFGGLRGSTVSSGYSK